MKQSSMNKRQQAQARIGFVVVVLFLAAVGAGAFQYFRAVRAPKVAAANEVIALSPGTGAVLNGLKSPIEIRFYSLLDPASTSESLRAFAERVNRLLGEYERAGNRNIRVIRFGEISEANAKAAAADGISAFNRDKGDACYLGITAVRDGQKESMPEISPDWEPALESDLSRVVARVNEMTPPGATPANVGTKELATAQKAIEANPNLASASLEQGTQILRDAAMAEFKAAVADMQNQTAAAEQRLSQGGAPASEIASEIQKIHAEQTAKMQEITARLHDEMAALTRNKSAAH